MKAVLVMTFVFSTVAVSAQNTVTLTEETKTITVADGDILIGTGGEKTYVTIPDGATVTLNGVTIPNGGINCAGNVTIILAAGSTNTVVGKYTKAGVTVAKNYTLTIKGSGTLNATGGDFAAAIGAEYGSSEKNKKVCGNIIIEEGTITAQGGDEAAGIGAGNDYSQCGDILILGGTITASGGYASAGIGTGRGDNKVTLSSICGDITIGGGTITATKGKDANNSIGIGLDGQIGTITIGGVVGAVSQSPYTTTVVSDSYTVKFNANGGSGSMSNQTVNVGRETPLARNSFTRSGFEFIGWSSTANGVVEYTNGQSVKNLVAKDGIKTLYAKWVSKESLPTGFHVDADYPETQTGFYYVNMPINDATTTVNIDDFKFFPFKIYDDGGKEMNASGSDGYLTIFSPSGYNIYLNGKVLAAKMQYQAIITVFDGSDANARKLGEFNSSNNISVSSTGNSITLYFRNWETDIQGLELTATTNMIYSITYNNIDGATFSTANPTSYTVEDNISLVNPTKDGYVFLGWTYYGQTEPTTTVTISKGSIGNKEFVANWQQKFGALTLVYADNRTTATLQGEFTSTESTSLNIENQIEVNELTFQRTFKKGIPATIMLPFDFTPDDNVGKFYTLASVAPINGVWTAKMSQPITGIIQANTPYIFMPTKDITPSNYMTFTDITLQSTKTINDNGSGDWTLYGVYEKTLLDDPNLVNYGFAGQSTADGISVGDFIRAGDGVWADPMRCYLTYNKNNGVLAKSALDLPDRIRVVFPDEVEQPDNGEIVTPVLEISSESGVKVWSFGGTLYIEAQPDMDYTIVDLSGRTIKQGVTHSTHEELNLNAKGIVIVKIGNKSFKLK